MSGECLDSSIFVYTFDDTDDRRRVIAPKMKRQVRHEDWLRFFRSTLKPMWSVYPTDDLLTRALEVRARYGYSFYDPLIVSAAIEGGCATLYSEDMQHDQLIETVRIVDPFRDG